jgi:hypothetical protein
MKKIIFAILVLIVVGGLVWTYGDREDAPVTQETQLDEQITARLNEPFTIKNHTITAWAVTEDSRCASDVECIQAGRVKVAINIDSPSGFSTKELEPGQEYTTETISITLDKVEPYPLSTHKITDSEYRFIFTIRNR